MGVLALTSTEDVLLVRQFREPVRREMLEIPAGLRDVEGETPEECARRELVEETDTPLRLEPLGRGFFSSSGLTDERYLYRAAVPDAPRPIRRPGSTWFECRSRRRSARPRRGHRGRQDGAGAPAGGPGRRLTDLGTRSSRRPKRFGGRASPASGTLRGPEEGGRSMIIGIPTEVKDNEYRVAATPRGARARRGGSRGRAAVRAPARLRDRR